MLDNALYFFLAFYNNIKRVCYLSFIGPGFFLQVPGLALTIDFNKTPDFCPTMQSTKLVVHMFFIAHRLNNNKIKTFSYLILVHKWRTKPLLVIKRPAYPLYDSQDSLLRIPVD